MNQDSIDTLTRLLAAQMADKVWSEIKSDPVALKAVVSAMVQRITQQLERGVYVDDYERRAISDGALKLMRDDKDVAEAYRAALRERLLNPDTIAKVVAQYTVDMNLRLNR